ncbi:uncharacterized protein LOC122094739 [Macadamia integrifolia]|uniref:uncharacterized protein LOC122094739 n=1 Tax=Macadamia integrifolia TaxID=60698 RepID=UPI001C52D188|nr:uncharacterized protein LOC122094739 [Macadamia integrifolia]
MVTGASKSENENDGKRLVGDGDPHGDRPPDRGKQRQITNFWRPVSSPPLPQSESTEASLPTLPRPTDPVPKKSYARAVIIPQEEYEERLNKYCFALIGRLNFRFISLDEIISEVAGNWILKEKVKLIPMGKEFTIFQFDLERDMASIWRRGSTKLGGQYVRFQRWCPDFNIHEKPVNKALIWVRFPELPLEYWHEKVLLTMAKVVGRPVELDQRTKQVLYGNFTRVLVEINVQSERLEEIQVERKHPGIDAPF